MTLPNNTPQVPMRFLSVCSGMEAASVAWEPLGWKAVAFSEIEAFPCAILSTRYPNIPNYGSLTEYQSWPIEPGSIDLLVGGTPCQSFSVAGLRKGLADPRGNLALVFLGLADKLKPRWIVWENVPGVLSSDGGRDFGSFLGALEQLGYGWAYRVLDAQYFGVPQRRRRVFVVASLGGRDVASSVLLEPESVCWNPTTRRKKGQEAAANSDRSVDPRGCWWDGGQVSQTLDAVMPIPIQDGREMEKKQNGMGVANEGDPAYTIDTTGAQAIAIQGTIIGRGHGVPSIFDTRTTHAVVEPPTYPINTLTLGGRPDPVNDARMTMGVGNNGDPQFTLQAAHSHAVATAMAVRRLTPVECERLQGFPDNWSQIPWKGKPEDQCPDGPRYKACGNSMAVPVMRWIGEQIARVESKKI